MKFLAIILVGLYQMAKSLILFALVLPISIVTLIIDMIRNGGLPRY